MKGFFNLNKVSMVIIGYIVFHNTHIFVVSLSLVKIWSWIVCSRALNSSLKIYVLDFYHVHEVWHFRGLVVKCVHNMDGNVLFLCIRAIWRKKQILENLGGINEVAFNMNTIPFHSLSNVENVHWQCDNDLSMFNDTKRKTRFCDFNLWLKINHKSF